MARLLAPALRALLQDSVDYAGAFPPASLGVREAYRNFEEYRRGEHAWLLRNFVVSGRDLDLLLPEALGPFSVVAQSDHARGACIESRVFIDTAKPFYWETRDLEAVARVRGLAKLRAGGVSSDAIPCAEEITDFLEHAAALRIGCKFTAGLHEAIRSERMLTYEIDSPRALMHGFANVFLAAAFAWFGENCARRVLLETDPAAFRFDERAHWRDFSLSEQQIAEARQKFANSFGSCSFLEPVESLRRLGWLA